MRHFASQYFTKNERRSLLILGGLVLISILLIYLIYYYDKPQLYIMDDLLPKAIIDSIEANTIIEKDKEKFDLKQAQKNQKNLKKFDPNTISIDTLRKMGIDKFASSNLEKYRKKGSIKSKAQFFKIYGMQKYAEMLDSLIQIDSSSSYHKNFKPNKDYKKSEYKKLENEKYENKNSSHLYANKDSNTIKPKSSFTASSTRIAIVKIKIVELNSADSFELESIRGIGAYLASKIVKYKNELGGFYEVEQLEEIYGMRAETFMNINHLVKADVDLIKKIKINSIEENLLAAHPYIGRKTAAILMRYKKQHGDYKNLNDLKRVKIFDEEDIEKLKWYLSFE